MRQRAVRPPVDILAARLGDLSDHRQLAHVGSDAKAGPLVGVGLSVLEVQAFRQVVDGTAAVVVFHQDGTRERREAVHQGRRGLLSSFFFSVGLHPLGGRWIQEHYLTHNEEQETYSYYGPLNKMAFNVGFHNEHHDFPSVPWNKLPQIKSTAPGYYNSLISHNSWTKLFLRFIFDREISLFSRIVRKNRGAVAISDESKPDIDLVADKV